MFIITPQTILKKELKESIESYDEETKKLQVTNNLLFFQKKKTNQYFLNLESTKIFRRSNSGN